jgi:hypothetical protein
MVILLFSSIGLTTTARCSQMVKGVMKKSSTVMWDVVPVLSRSSCAGFIPKQLIQNFSKLLTSKF